MFERDIPEKNNLIVTKALIDKEKLRLQPDELPTILGSYNMEAKKKNNINLPYCNNCKKSIQCPLQKNATPAN